MTAWSVPRGRDAVVAALRMLTRIPVPGAGVETTGAAAYGLVGAFVGVLGAVPVLLVGGIVPSVAAILAIATMAVVSGGLHLDGLADTADALLAPDRVRAETARKDPAIGSGGAVALVLTLAVQIAALIEISTAAGPAVAAAACVAAGAASRSLPVVLVAVRRSSRPSAGLGAWFVDRVGRREAALALATGVLVVIVAGLLADSAAVPIGTAIGTAIGLLAAAALQRARGQLDGDLMGASVELGLAAILATTAVTVAATWPAG